MTITRERQPPDSGKIVAFATNRGLAVLGTAGEPRLGASDAVNSIFAACPGDAVLRLRSAGRSGLPGRAIDDAAGPCDELGPDAGTGGVDALATGRSSVDRRSGAGYARARGSRLSRALHLASVPAAARRRPALPASGRSDLRARQCGRRALRDLSM